MRYPFMARANDYVRQARRGLWNDETTDDRSRTIRRIDRNLKELYKEKRIPTMDPKYMEYDSIQAYLEAEMDRKGRSPEMVLRETSLLLSICDDSGNPDAEFMSRKFHRFHHRANNLVPLPSMKMEDVHAIIDGAMREEEFVALRSYMGCVLAFGAGARTKEIQYAKADLLEPDEGMIMFDVVKGLGKYGRPRVVPLRIEAIPALRRYLKRRAEFLEENGISSPYLFFNIHNGDHLGVNMSQKMREVVMGDLGIDFDFRACRRAYFTCCREDGVAMDDLVGPAGHRDDRQLRNYYLRYDSGEDALKVRSVLTKAQRKNLRNQN